MKQGTRSACAALAIGLSLALVLLLGATVAFASPATPTDLAHGHVIVQFGDHDLVAREITFTAPISGSRALELTGLDVITSSTAFGTAVCSINGVGCPADDCFCGGSTYWGYNHWDGSAWQGYMVGSDGSTLSDGAVEGWRWGEFGSTMWPARPVTAALQALDWLRLRQSATDGGFGGDSSTSEAMLALGANGYRANDVRGQAGAPTLSGYQLAYATRYAGQGAGPAGKLAVGMEAVQACLPRNMAQPADYYNSQTGAYFNGTISQAWAMLGTMALSQTVPAAAVTYLEGLAQANGGWEWAPGMGTDTNSTALALQALVASGVPTNTTVISNGLSYLKSAQNTDGGFAYDPNSTSDTTSDSDSTAYIIQALLATGRDPTSAAWTKNGNTPLSYLLSLQLPGGSFEWQKGTGANQLATEQSIVALLGRPFPLRRALAESCAGTYLPSVAH